METSIVLHYTGVAGILELEKRLPDVVVAVWFQVTWEIHASKPMSAKGSFAGFTCLGPGDFSFFIPLNWSPYHTILEQSLAVC